MKEAYITDLQGRYIEPTLVADSVTGVFDHYEKSGEPADGSSDNNKQLIGYRVAIPMQDGLYSPTFDLAGYNQAQQDYKVANEQYQSLLKNYNPTSGQEAPTLPTVDWSQFWHHGLTDEEIEQLKPSPSPILSVEDRVTSVEQGLTDTMLASVELYESNENAHTSSTDAMLGLVELYSIIEQQGERIAQLEAMLNNTKGSEV